MLVNSFSVSFKSVNKSNNSRSFTLHYNFYQSIQRSCVLCNKFYRSIIQFYLSYISHNNYGGILSVLLNGSLNKRKPISVLLCALIVKL